MALHQAIQEELEMLRERFPGAVELTLDQYAEYFGINRRYAPQHFNKMNLSINKINHKRIGRRIIIPMLDFAYWLAQQKVVNGNMLIITADSIDMKSRRGYAQSQKNYRIG